MTLRSALSRHTEAFHGRRASACERTLVAWGRSPSQFKNTVKARTQLRDLDLQQALSDGYASIQHEDGYRTVWIFLEPRQEYDLVEEYWRARQRAQLALTPHGWFWHLPPEDLQLAAKFWKNFGSIGWPITLNVHTSTVEGEYFWLDLGDFWNKQRRFKAVTKLWVALEDINELRKSWAELRVELTQINSAEDFPLGAAPKPEGSGFNWLESPLCEYLTSPDSKDRSSENALNEMEGPTLQRETVSIVQWELNAQLRAVPGWQPQSNMTRPGFELTLVPVTLWSAMWYLFALDTQANVGLRICPHCNKLFYPPRKDRLYCTSELQVQHSKLEWWQQHKDEELQKRKAKRRQKARKRAHEREV